jgi:predicted CXXCH cytochrome family protein
MQPPDRRVIIAMLRPNGNVIRWLTTLVLGIALASTSLLLNSCGTLERTRMIPPQIEGATFVGDAACADCHAEISRIFPASPHARLTFASEKMPGAGGCESCHGPGSKHIAAIGTGSFEKFILNPGKKPEACLQCHIGTHAEFRLPHQHPVLAGKMSCSDCHDPHGADIFKPAGGLAMARQNESCAECHQDQARPFVFEHPAMREGCTSCHQPHGSVNDKLLTVRDSNLCLRCHAQTPDPSGGPGLFIGRVNHTGFVRFGTCWTAGCHSSVHGSNTQPNFFY